LLFSSTFSHPLLSICCLLFPFFLSYPPPSAPFGQSLFSLICHQRLSSAALCLSFCCLMPPFLKGAQA
jgi:hypothetical protein